MDGSTTSGIVILFRAEIEEVTLAHSGKISGTVMGARLVGAGMVAVRVEVRDKVTVTSWGWALILFALLVTVPIDVAVVVTEVVAVEGLRF